MCVVSMITDFYYEKWKEQIIPPPWDNNGKIIPPQGGSGTSPPTTPAITPEEIEEFRKLLERAREYDKKNSEPECEMQSKKDLIKELADKLGVKIDFI